MNTTKFFVSLVLVVVSVVVSIVFIRVTDASGSDSTIQRGRYVSIIGGCNDCHTEGYDENAGKVPEAEWLMGTSLGWRGPWGTTYAINLRIYFASLTEDQWLSVARSMRSRPPMPWFNVAAMTDEDLRALYRFVRSLGPVGKPVPAFLPPDQEPPAPFVLFP